MSLILFYIVDLFVTFLGTIWGLILTVFSGQKKLTFLIALTQSDATRKGPPLL